MQPISRRNMLKKAGWLGTSLVVGLPMRATPAEEPSAKTPPGSRTLKVVVTGGHPGDPEYGCGGTIARYTRSGHEVVLLYLNQGDPSASRPETAKTARMLEAKAACNLLKAKPLYAGQIDGK